MSSKALSSFISLAEINERSKILASNKSKFNDFWVFGAGNNGRKINRLLKQNDKRVIGFIDDTPEKNGQTIENVKVFNFDDFNEKAKSSDNVIISIFSTKNSFLNLCEKLGDSPINKIISAHEIFATYNQKFYFIESLSGIEKNFQRYEDLFELLIDDVSKKRLISYLKLKVYFDFYKETDAFFEPLNDVLKLETDVTFFDAGAFDGDTVILFNELFKDKVKNNIAFEPDYANYTILLKNLSDKDINSLCLNAAVSDQTKILRFNAESNMGSALNANGNTLIQAISIDMLSLNLPKDTRLVVKMDVEGFELDALNGMEDTIRAAKPILAVSAYHRPNDLVDIVEKVLSINDSYRISLRFHGFDGGDLMAYFV